jgi:Zn-dependent protease with chaperone function
MAVIWRGRAHLFDGETSKPLQIDLSLEPDGLEIHAADVSRFVGHYRRKVLRWLEVREDGLIRLELTAHPGVLLEIQSQEARHFLREHGLDRVHWLPHVSLAAKVSIAVMGLVLFIAGFFLFGLDGFSRLVVKHIPDSVDRELGEKIPSLHLISDTTIGPVTCPDLDSARSKSIALIQSLGAPGLEGLRVEVAPDTSIVNAFALPGGRVVVYTGMLRMLETQQEWLALLAHEVGHVSMRHGMRSMVRSSVLTITAALIFGDAAGLSAFIFDNAQRLTTLKYSRVDEEEADAFASEMLLATGYSTQGLAQLFEKLDRVQEQPEWSAFLSTHPASGERIAAAKAKAVGNKNALSDFLTEAEWKALRSGCGP